MSPPDLERERGVGRDAGVDVDVEGGPDLVEAGGADADDASFGGRAGGGVAPQPWAWHAVRVSGLFLAVLLVWHVVVTFVVHDVGQTTAVTVTNHWQDPTWRALEWITLVLALVHGGIGVDLVLRRRSWSPEAMVTATRIANLLVIGALSGAASVVVLTYR